MATAMSTFLGIQAQFKILHWQTGSYSKHKAFDGIYEMFDGLIDSFMESYMGKYGRMVLEGAEDNIQLMNIGEVNMDDYLETLTQFLLSFNNKLDDHKDSDLLNIRDEMLGEVNKLKYLLTLK